MLFDYDINHYTHEDLKKLFNVKDGEQMSIEELDIRISNIKYTAELKTKDKNELLAISNFLSIAKEKFKLNDSSLAIPYNNVYPLTDQLKTTFIPNKMLDKNEHSIIEKTPDIIIPDEVKYININSADRDKMAWPLSSCFEIELPDSFKDVTFMSLYDFNFYCHVFNFTHFYQNTQITFGEGTLTNGVRQNYYTASIDDGFYTEDNLITAITNAMNTAASTTAYACSVNSITKRFEISNASNDFDLDFTATHVYNNNKWQNRNIYDSSIFWGLGYFIGFEKMTYSSTVQSDGLGGTTNKLISPNVSTTVINHNIFLEIDGFNHVQQTRGQTGVVNSYFSRIPLYNGYSNDAGGFERANISVERLSKIKIKLRFHNGMVLDLQNQDFDITLIVGCKK